MIIDPKEKKIIIEISEGAGGAARRKPQPEEENAGFLPVRSFGQKYYRRRRPRAEAVTVKIFDLGQIITEDEIYVDSNFQVITDLDLSIGYNDFITLPVIRAAEAALIASGLDSFKELKPDEIGKYYLSLADDNGANPLDEDNPNFTEQGLKIEKSQINGDYLELTVNTYSGAFGAELFYNIPLIGEDVLITIEHNREAETVDYIPRNGDEIYLVPKLTKNDVSTFNGDNTLTVERTRTNLFYIAVPRQFYLNETSPLYHVKAFLQENSDDYDLIKEMTAFCIALPNARLIKNIGEGLWSYDSPSTNPILDPVTPPPSAFGYDNVSFSEINTSDFDFDSIALPLRAVIRRDESLFYVW